MLCPNCGSPNSDLAQACARCAQPLLQAHTANMPSLPTPPPPMPPGASHAAAAPAPAYAAPAPPLAVPPRKMHWLGVLGIAAIAILAALYAFTAPLPALPNAEQAAGYRLGTMLAATGLPLLIAYLVAGRRKARNPNLFALLFFLIGFFIIGANAGKAYGWGGFHGLETDDQKVSRLMREAAGLQPVHKPLFGEDAVETTMRDMFRELLAFNKEYQAATQKLDISQVSRLNTAQAFADPATVREGLRQLHASCDLDARQEERMQAMIDKFRRRFGELASSSSERESFINSFNQGLAKSAPVRQRAISAEKSWIAAVDSVYDYAGAQHAYFRLSNDRLVITNHAALEEFNSRVEKMDRLRDAFLQAKKDLDVFQNKTLQKTGLTPKEAGREE